MALQLRKARHTDGTMHAVAAIFLFLGFMVGCLTLAWAEENRQQPTRVLRIVCESGSFQDVTRSENDLCRGLCVARPILDSARRRYARWHLERPQLFSRTRLERYHASVWSADVHDAVDYERGDATHRESRATASPAS